MNVFLPTSIHALGIGSGIMMDMDDEIHEMLIMIKATLIQNSLNRKRIRPIAVC